MLHHESTPCQAVPAGGASLPAYARMPINRCNLPPVILGSLTFQLQPVSLQIDSVLELHRQLFDALDPIDDWEVRAQHFQQYMASAFLLGKAEQAGSKGASQRVRRDKADYARLLRGWMFNPDGLEAAVLKRWVESRFGLVPRSHGGPIRNCAEERYDTYLADAARGLYNTNALESQLDLLFTFCQYELERRYPAQRHWLLYRGVNRIEDHEVLARDGGRHYLLLMNSLNSFTSDRLLSDTFGDFVLETRVPFAKLLYFPDLLPNTLRGEKEYLVIGGVYRTYVGR